MSVILGPVPHGRTARRFAGRSRGTFLLVRDAFLNGHEATSGSDRPSHWHEGSCEILDDWLAAQGATFSDLLAPAVDTLQPFKYRRDIPWKSLPVVERPRRDHGEGGVSVMGVERDGRLSERTPERWRHHLSLFQETRAVVYDAPTLDERLVWHALGPVHEDFLASRIPVFHFDGEWIHHVPSGTMEAIADRGCLFDRLSFNLHASMSIFMSRASIHLAAKENWTVDRLYRMTGNGPGSTHTTPLGLQMLHDLLEKPGEAPRIDCSSGPAPTDKLLKAARRWVERDPDGRETFVWKGNGSHPPLRVDPRSQRTGSVWIQTPAHCLRLMAASGHVGIGDDEELRPTGDARRVMEIVGNGTRDADLPLRWAGKGMDTVPSVDRWLNATMRKVKRRVAPLSSAPHVRRLEAAPPFERNHGMLVYASIVDLPPRPDAAMIADIDALEALEDALPFRERSSGVVRTPSRVVTDRGCAIWFGVSLGVVHPYRAGLVREDSLRVLDDDVARVRATLPASFLPHVSTKPSRLLVVQWTEAPEVAAEAWRRVEVDPVPASLVYPKLGPL